GWLRWGERARIVLPSRIAVEVTVVDDAGAALEVPAVEATGIDDLGGSAKLERIGAAWCGQLRRGRYRVVVDPVRPTRGFAPPVPSGRSATLIVSPPGPERFQFKMLQSGTRRVRVLDADGQPASYAIVQLLEATGSGPHDPGRHRAPEGRYTLVGWPAE